MKPIKSRKPLKAKQPLKAKTPIKVNLKPKKQKKPMVSKLKKEADKWFSLYVRYRDGKQVDGEWFSQCITSDVWIPFKKAQAGHFMSRRYNSTRYEEENVNTQSYRDNVMMHGEQYKYAIALDLKYGTGTAQKLATMARIPHQFTVEELQQIIDDSKAQVVWYQSQT